MILILLIAAVLFALERSVAERFDKAQRTAEQNAGACCPIWKERCRPPDFKGNLSASALA